jgi:hypothetical protein
MVSMSFIRSGPRHRGKNVHRLQNNRSRASSPRIATFRLFSKPYLGDKLREDFQSRPKCPSAKDFYDSNDLWSVSARKSPVFRINSQNLRAKDENLHLLSMGCFQTDTKIL